MLEYKRKFSHTHFRFAESIEQHTHSQAQRCVDCDGAIQLLEDTGDSPQDMRQLQASKEKEVNLTPITLNKHSYQNSREITCHGAL